MTWKPIKGFEGLYEIHRCGEVKSLHRVVKHRKWSRTIPGKILKPKKDKDGYVTVGLSKEGTTKHLKTHRLLAQAFLPNANNKPCVNHLDGDKSNNDLENLEWCTVKENNIHAFKNFGKNMRKGSDHHLSKDSEEKRKYMFEMLDIGIHFKLVAWALDVHFGTIQKWRRLYAK